MTLVRLRLQLAIRFRTAPVPARLPRLAAHAATKFRYRFTLAVREAGPLFEPLFHPQRRRRARPKLAPSTCPGCSFTSHISPPMMARESGEGLPQKTFSTSNIQLIAHDLPPGVVALGIMGLAGTQKADRHDRSLNGLTGRGGPKRIPLRDFTERADRREHSQHQRDVAPHRRAVGRCRA
jgi:hypothetical protein